MSVGMSCGEKSVCLGDTDVIPGEKNGSAALGSGVEEMEMFLYQ